ncbi:histidine kinase [Chitinibacter bivalviorum]|uniref:Histidine kinase n=1 Tax=Chitinibacter bivalviorum TaxID=2739434 RepID=A0A7H9BKY5_9NEIS|nr:histidine kinase [Chitinibacter bivalviorum]QLG89169.1 histidine kinase [Chitinibacter bivalviorum]
MEQNAPITPDFRNLGVIFRALVLVHLGMLLYVFAAMNSWAEWAAQLTDVAFWVEPILMGAMGLLALLAPQLAKWPYARSVLVIYGLVLCWTVLVYQGMGKILLDTLQVNLMQMVTVAMMVTAFMLWHYQMWLRTLSPRLAEARLVALQARIRPHFFFNSLNAVLSLIRSQPKLAEQLLQNLSELFRVAMGNQTSLSTLEREVELARGYLEIEKARLGDRLHVEWHIDNMPSKASIPPLILQPLLENAVYHGIEPSINTGTIQVNAFRVRNEVHIDIRNPIVHEGVQRIGNGMAQDNVRERLLLYFDAEANLSIQRGNDYYQIHIVLPYRELNNEQSVAPIFS